MLYGFVILTFSSLIKYPIVSESVGVAGLVALLVSVPLRRRADKYKLPGEEWLFLKGYHVVEDLADHLKEQEPPPHYKEQAGKELTRLVDSIDRDWKVGDFRLASRTLASLFELKRGFREAILPAIAKGGDKVEGCLNVMVHFCEFLLKKEPTIQDVTTLNKQISPLYGEKREKAWYLRLFEWARFRMRWNTIVPGVITLSSGWVLFVVLTFYGFSKEAAVTPSVETSLGFTSIYAGWLGVQSYIRRKSQD
jgi:hypothetical protein